MYSQKTKKGRYRFFESYTDPITGIRKTASVTLDKDTAKSRKHAQALLYARIWDLTHETIKPSNMTLEGLVEAYKAAQDGVLRPQTITRNTIIMKKAAAMFPDVPLDNLNARIVATAFDKWDATGTKKNGRMRRLKTLLRWGYKRDYIKDIDWLDKLPIYPDNVKQRRDLKYLEQKELKAVLDAALPEYRDLIEFMALTGLRVGEAIALTPADIDKVIHVNKTYSAITGEVGPTKTADSTRDVYIQSELRPLVDRLPKNGKWLFTRNGKRVDYYSFNKYFAELTQRVIGRRLTTHALRHTHTSLLAAAGVSLDLISRRLGHSDSAVTRDIYLHVTEKLKDKDAELLDETNLL